MNIIKLTPEQALDNWGYLRVYFLSALAQGQGESLITDYARKVLNNHAQCWAVIDDGTIVGAGLTEHIQYTQHTTLHIICFGGSDFEEQSKVFHTIISYAKDHGCKSIEQWGRKGWAKTLPKYIPEFKEVYTVMRMDL